MSQQAQPLSHKETILRIREIFSILTQGVEMEYYEIDNKTKKARGAKMIVWMDSDIFRICVGSVRPSMTERQNGNISTGIYLRDISEIREGTFSYQFDHAEYKPQRANCLSLVGSERTISLELPSEFTRDWFLTRMRLLAEDILVAQEKQIRKYRVWENYHSQLRLNDMGSITNLEELLEKGILVKGHLRSGEIVSAVLKYDKPENDLTLNYSIKTSLFSFATMMVHRLNVSDVSEIRPGSHSLGFVKTNSTEYDNEMLSIVGSQNVFDLQFVNKNTRDIFAQRLFQFVTHFLDSSKVFYDASAAGIAGSNPYQR